MPMAAAASLEIVPIAPRSASQAGPELIALRGARIFASLTTESLTALAAGSAIERFSRRAIIASEGTKPSHAYLVLRGRVRAVRRADSGREVTLESYRPGELLADATIAPDLSLTHDWEASEPVEVLAIDPQLLAARVSESPALMRALTAQLYARLARSQDLVVGLALADVPARVTAALRALAANEGTATTEGVLIRHRPTQQELANSIGACRETVSRIVSDLARRGLVIPRGRSLVITQQLLGRAA